MEQLCVWINLPIIIKGQGDSNFYLHGKKQLWNSTSHMTIYFTQQKSIIAE